MGLSCKFSLKPIHWSLSIGILIMARHPQWWRDDHNPHILWPWHICRNPRLTFSLVSSLRTPMKKNINHYPSSDWTYRISPFEISDNSSKSMGYLYHIFFNITRGVWENSHTLLERPPVQALEPYGVKVRFHLQAVCVVGVFQAREDEQKRDDTYDILWLFGSGHILVAGKWMTMGCFPLQLGGMRET